MNKTIRKIRIKFIVAALLIAVVMLSLQLVFLYVITDFISGNDMGNINNIITTRVSQEVYATDCQKINLAGENLNNYYIPVQPDKIEKIVFNGTIVNTNDADWYCGGSNIKFKGVTKDGKLIRGQKDFAFNKNNTSITIDFYDVTAPDGLYAECEKFNQGITISYEWWTASSADTSGKDTHLGISSMEIYFNDLAYAGSYISPIFRNEKDTFTSDLPEVLRNCNYFYIVYDENSIHEVNNGNSGIFSDTAEAGFLLEEYRDLAYGESRNCTVDSNRTYTCLKAETGNGDVLVFVEKETTDSAFNRLTKISIVVDILAIAVLFVIVFFYSRMISKPLEDAYKKQQQFISDASHELKTPVTVISAVAEVLEDEAGQNRWTSSIKFQTKRMMSLIQNLLDLAHNEESGGNIPVEEINLSQLVNNCILSFDATAFECGISLNSDISPDIFISADSGKINQLISILTDNAIKYSDAGGRVDVVLNSDYRILISNDCRNFDITKKDLYFDRFYRGDPSHSSEKPGYGLGLPIASSIADIYSFKIDISYSFPRVLFIIDMSCRALEIKK